MNVAGRTVKLTPIDHDLLVEKSVEAGRFVHHDRLRFDISSQVSRPALVCGDAGKPAVVPTSRQ